MQAAAEEKEALREARRGKAEAEAGRRAAEKRAEAAEANAKCSAAAAEREAAEAARAQAELRSYEADVDWQLNGRDERREEAAAAQTAALRAEHHRALSSAARQLAAAEAAAASARTRLLAEQQSHGWTKKRATDNAAMAEQLGVELERDRLLSAQLETAYDHIRHRDERISALMREQAAALPARNASAGGRCSGCGRMPGLVTIAHQPGTPWPLWRCDFARRLMQEGHIDPVNLPKVLSGAFCFYTGELPSEDYTCDAQFGPRCFARLGAMDDARDKAVNAKDENGSFLMTDGGAGDRRGVNCSRNSQMHVQLLACWCPLSCKPIIKPLGLKVTPRDTGAQLAATNIDAYTNAGLRWCFFSGTSGDHTEHSSGVSGERALVIQHAEQAGCPKGRADNFGCLRHGYQLVNGAGLKALWSVKAQAEAHARLMWENFTADRGTNAKQWIAAGLPEWLWLKAKWTEPTTSKWGVMEAWAVQGWNVWNVKVDVGGQQVNAHVCFAEHMCRRLRGDDGTGAGGDRLQKWKMHLGIVSNPVYVALFTALLDFDDYFRQRHAWCLAKDRQYDFPPPFHAREVAVRMCQDESQLKDAIDAPKLIFARTTKFLETPSLHPNKLADADKTELETRMVAAATDMHSKHRDWNWQQWTRGRLLFGVATDEVYRLPFVQALLPLVGVGRALEEFMDASKTQPSPMPNDDVGPRLSALLAEHAEDIKKQWQIWSLGDHIKEWLLLATAPRCPPLTPPTFLPGLVPGLWGVFIPMIFIVPTDNTPCEQRVSVYRHEVSQNQSEWTVETQWMYTCRMQPERERLKGVRSAVSRYLDAKALANALAGNALSRHASSKAQLAELWRWQLERALGYTSLEAQLLGLAKLVQAVKQRRLDAHRRAEASIVTVLAFTHARGPAGGKRKAAVTAKEAVAFCPTLAELGQKGRQLSATAAGVKSRMRQVVAEVKAATLQKAASQAAHKAEKQAAARQAAAERAAQQRDKEVTDSEVRISRMWAAAAESEEEEDGEDSGDDGEDSSDGEGSDGGWGAQDESEEDEAEDEEGDQEGDEPAESPKRARTAECAEEAMAQAISSEAEGAQRRAEERASAAVQVREQRHAARGEAIDEQGRLRLRCIQLRAKVSNYWQRMRVPPPQRTRERLDGAPRDVLAAFEELKELEEKLKTLSA